MDKFTAGFLFLEAFIDDGGYVGPKVREAAPRTVEVVKRSDYANGFRVLPKRWIVERTVAWLTINRRLVKDVERYVHTALTYIHIAMIKLMSRRLARYVHC